MHDFLLTNTNIHDLFISTDSQKGIEMSNREYEHLTGTPQCDLRNEMIMRIKVALSSINNNSIRKNLAIQLLTARISHPQSLNDPAKWRSTIQLWYKIVNISPQIGYILSEYDIDFQRRQSIMIDYAMTIE